jgi:hypothetical protein
MSITICIAFATKSEKIEISTERIDKQGTGQGKTRNEIKANASWAEMSNES